MTRDLIDFIEIDVDMLTPSQYATEGIFKYDSYRCIKDWLIDNVRILLLSATPYKLYSTLDEISEENVDAHYSEFLEVINFLKK